MTDTGERDNIVTLLRKSIALEPNVRLCAMIDDIAARVHTGEIRALAAAWLYSSGELSFHVCSEPEDEDLISAVISDMEFDLRLSRVADYRKDSGDGSA